MRASSDLTPQLGQELARPPASLDAAQRRTSPARHALAHGRLGYLQRGRHLGVLAAHRARAPPRPRAARPRKLGQQHAGRIVGQQLDQPRILRREPPACASRAAAHLAARPHRRRLGVGQPPCGDLEQPRGAGASGRADSACCRRDRGRERLSRQIGCHMEIAGPAHEVAEHRPRMTVVEDPERFRLPASEQVLVARSRSPPHHTSLPSKRSSRTPPRVVNGESRMSHATARARDIDARHVPSSRRPDREGHRTRCPSARHAAHHAAAARRR